MTNLTERARELREPNWWPVIGWGFAWLATCCVTGMCMTAFHHATGNLAQVLWACAALISFSFSLDFIRAMFRDGRPK